MWHDVFERGSSLLKPLWGFSDSNVKHFYNFLHFSFSRKLTHIVLISLCVFKGTWLPLHCAQLAVLLHPSHCNHQLFGIKPMMLLSLSTAS